MNSPGSLSVSASWRSDLEAKDRIRAEHDDGINLKAEFEIRHLHAKLDLLLTHQWQKLLEIQEIQMELMQESQNYNRRS